MDRPHRDSRQHNGTHRNRRGDQWAALDNRFLCVVSAPIAVWDRTTCRGRTFHEVINDPRPIAGHRHQRDFGDVFHIAQIAVGDSADLHCRKGFGTSAMPRPASTKVMAVAICDTLCATSGINPPFSANSPHHSGQTGVRLSGNHDEFLEPQCERCDNFFRCQRMTAPKRHDHPLPSKVDHFMSAPEASGRRTKPTSRESSRRRSICSLVASSTRCISTSG